ncbi:MAG: hypothetical protein K8S25_01425 [Alphaproteobacteria bacterium]|nr:hypothetical protein [Alphaproteobacteria bacterium]
MFQFADNGDACADHQQRRANDLAKNLQLSLICYGLACFVAGALLQLTNFIMFSGVMFVGPGSYPINKDGLIIGAMAYVVICLFGVPFSWFILVAQSFLWAPILVLSASRGIAVRICVVLAAPIAAVALYQIGAIDTFQHLTRLTALGPPFAPMVLEAVALTAITIAYFAFEELFLRLYGSRKE